MLLPLSVEGRVCSLADGRVDVSGSISIDEIISNNRPLHVGEQSGVPANTLTTITTMPSNGIKYITKILCSGEDNARWEIYINSVKKCTQRTTDRNVSFDFNLPLKILASEVVDVKAIFFGSGANADLQCTIFGYAA